VNATNSKLSYDRKLFTSALGKRIKQLRKDRGWTLRDMVVLHNYHQTQIQRIESGVSISITTLLRIAEVFQIPVEKLVAGLGVIDGGEQRSKPAKKNPPS
jgi:transcriptional regulator with XRE-family HTH domain